MKRWLVLLAALSLLLSLAACGGSANYKDGTYTGTSPVHEGDDEDGSGAGYGVVTLTIEGGEIVAADFKTYEPDGTLKDEDYGKQNGEVANSDFYNKAQRAVLASQKYGEQLAETGDVKQVDAITGATISYSEFEEAVADALKQARE